MSSLGSIPTAFGTSTPTPVDVLPIADEENQPSSSHPPGPENTSGKDSSEPITVAPQLPRSSLAPLDLRNLPEEFYANDGIVPLFSQWHPGSCVTGIRCLHKASAAGDSTTPTSSLSASIQLVVADDGHSHPIHPPPTLTKPNVFQVLDLHADKSTRHHHLSIMPLWMGIDSQRAFWEDVGAWLCEVDRVRAVH
jgi:hypothetical protein